ncbi:MAG: HlyD family type I secretion periplasmic adaptor subunit [Proteobacteria bacterium]|nr:HlyD family type I secretion periplasmic adaptor subunit [Pseudomonadota bacterium]
MVTSRVSGLLGRAWEWGEAAWREGREQGQDVSRTTHLLFFLCAAFCLLFLIWSAIFRLDIVSVAGGEVIPRSRVKRVQHLEGGIVRKIMVREGDSVAEGQPLVILEETASESSVDELELRVQSLRIEIARLEAEENDLEEPVFPPDLLEKAPAQLNEALDLFFTSRRKYENEISTLEESISQRQQDILEIESRLVNLRRNLPLVRKQVARDHDLFNEQLIREDQLIGHQKELNNLLSEINENNAALSRAHSMYASANATLAGFKNEFTEEVRTNLKKSRQELLEMSQRLRKFTDIEQRTVIRSPVDGLVNSLYIVNEGEVVRPGVTVMDIVPAGDKLVIEAKLPVRDIGFVAVGQTAVIKLPTADARRFGSIEGEVVNISPDAVTLQSGETFYRVRVETEKGYFEQSGHKHHLFPGMQVICAIHTGTRTVLEYLCYPYFDALANGLQER